MSCVYYDKNLQKSVPCTIVPCRIKIFDHMTKRYYLITVQYDDVSLTSYNLTMNQILKYCSDYVDIHELYPCGTQDEIDYFNNHKGISKTVYIDKELIRYEKLYSYISNTTEISSDILYNLCNLFVTDLQFKYLNYNERVFMKLLSDSQFTQSPEVILVPGCIRMLSNLFDKYNGELSKEHILDNYNNYIQHELLFSLTLNVMNIKNNMNIIKNEHPELFIIQ